MPSRLAFDDKVTSSHLLIIVLVMITDDVDAIRIRG